MVEDIECMANGSWLMAYDMGSSLLSAAGFIDDACAGSGAAPPIRGLTGFDCGRDHRLELLRFVQLHSDFVFGGDRRGNSQLESVNRFPAFLSSDRHLGEEIRLRLSAL